MNIQLATDTTIAHAGALLREGKMVAFPTETVYGLGANATSDKAVAQIFAAKDRPAFNPLIVHIDGVAMAMRCCLWNDTAARLAEAFWPGPLTLILPRRSPSRISLLASAGGNTVAIRNPSHPVARALLKEASLPIAAPSANRSGRISPTTAKHVGEELGDSVPLILDGGACPVGIESTVIDLSTEEAALLRPGSILREEVEAVLGRRVALSITPSAKSPGQMQVHYAPSLPLRINAAAPLPGEALLAFGREVPAGAKATVNLSAGGNVVEAAANLFAALRAHDSPEFTGIAVMPIPEEGLGVAINDRLRRAAIK